MPINKTKEWIESIVLRYNLCPFAHQPYQQNTIRYVVSTAKDISETVEEFISEIENLETGLATTTLIIFPNDHQDFSEYLDVFYLLEDTINALEKEQFFQLASFHPAYQFADSDFDDPANATNRSPYPMIHILRCIDVEKAIESHSDSLSIPQRNMKIMRALFS